MTSTASLPFALHSDFATALPELTAPGHGERQPDPQVALLNEPLCETLGLDPDWLRSAHGVQFLLGNANPEDQPPVAMAYSGFQFGQLSPVLGDGRALLLGEIATSAGLRDLHVKGSGPTAFSRSGSDGRGTLGSMLREYVVSRKLAELGVPTTEPLAVVSTGRAVVRDRGLPGGVVVRVAASHLRVGSFHYAQLHGGEELTAQLADYAIGRHFPQLADEDDPAARYRGLFDSVMDAQIPTVSRWQQLGFIHGVMNTDNTSISGETIDYGPCAFMEGFDPDTVFSSIDTRGRYRYGNQPLILGWNLARLAESLLPLLGSTPDAALEWAQKAINGFIDRFNEHYWSSTARDILGIDATGHTAQEWVDGYFAELRSAGTDITLANRAVWEAARGDGTRLDALLPASEWVARWREHTPTEPGKRAPLSIPRNRPLDAALEAAHAGDLGPIREIDAASVYDFHPELSEPDPDGLQGFRTFCGT